MPLSILFSALLFIAFGSACILGKYALGFAMPLPLWVASCAILGGLGLLLGQKFGRIFASLVIAFGYLATMFDLISSSIPQQGTPEIWAIYGRAFLAVAILTAISGFLSSRSVTNYLNRSDDTPKTKKT